MPKIDLTITISVVIAICAIISPIITTLLNNRHLYKMRKLDMQLDEQKQSKFYKRGMYEQYLRTVGKCITYSSDNALREYGESYAIAMAYFPEHLLADLIRINSLIMNHQCREATDSFNRFAPQIRAILRTM